MSTNLNEFCASQFWDLELTWNTTNPDFTICFHKTVLVWIPVIFLWMFAPYETYKLVKSKYRDIPWNFLNISKLVITCLLAISTIAELGYSLSKHTSGFTVPPVEFNTPFLLLVTYLLVALFIIYDKRRGIRSSGTLFIYWLLMVICGIPTFRHHVIKAFDKNISPEEESSFLSQILFSWITPFMISGFRKSLTENDLWRLNSRDRTTTVVPYFEKFWEKEWKRKHSKFHPKDARYKVDNESVHFKGVNRAMNPSVLKALIKAFWPLFFVGSVFKLLSDILQFINPQILRLLIDFNSSNQPLWKGLFYAFLLFINSELQSLLINQYFIRMYVVAIHVRSSLISALYRKALKISNEERRNSTVGEIVNLMSIDAQRFVDVMPYINMVWSGPLQIALSLYFLWGILGASVLTGVGLMILMIPLNGIIASVTQKLQIKDMKFKDERTKLMNEILNGIKVLKLYAWEIPFLNMVLDIRKKEIKVLTKSAYLSAGLSFLWTCAPFLVSMGSFATFVLSNENNVLDANTAFVSLALFNLLRFPMNMLPNLISMLIQVSVSVKRLNKFMAGEEIDSSIVSHDQVEIDPILIENASFTWGKSEDPCVLHDIDLRVVPNSLVAVVGQVGSGKSSLIHAILGELAKCNGHVNVKGSISFVPQQAWIQNASLRDNVLMYKPMQKEFYDKVIECCALKSDLDILPGGDETEIGEKGINLSGGQKQRVSLARAVYHNSDIYLLDDPLSAVDAHVGKHIFTNVIGPNSILKSKTRLLITHGISFLPQCDSIIVLKEGRISEVGSFKELICRKGPFSEFITQYMNENTEVCDEDIEQLEDIMADKSVPLEIKRQLSRQESQTSSIDVSESRRLSVGNIFQRSSSIYSKSENDDAIIKSDIDKKKLVLDEKVENDGVKIVVYYKYIREIGFLITSVFVLMWMISQGCSVGADIWLSIWSNYPEKSINNTAWRDQMLTVYGSFGIGQAITIMVGALFLAYGSMRAASVLHEKMLYAILQSPMSFFDTTPSGRILNRFSKDVNVMDTLIAMNFKGFVICFFSVISTFMIISMKTPLFVVIIVPIVIVYYFITKFYVSTSRQLKRLESITRSPIYGHFSETITGVSSIRAYGVQDIFINESNNRVDKNQVCYYPAIVANRWLAIGLELISNLISFFAALLSVIGKDELDPGSVGLSVGYAMSITAMFNWMVRISSELETNLVAIERIMEYSTLESEGDWNNEQIKPNSSWPESGNVIFSSYKTRYRQGLDLVLRGIDCDIKSGEKIGICGRTGAGKSSLTLALLRIIEASSGEITIDGVNIAELGLHLLRSRLTIIPQDPVLFSGTLRQNIDPFNVHSDEKIWMVLEQSHLKSFVKGLDTGLEHQVAESGENLSVGQRQLICLARALLRKTKILILDEATAAIDLETDDLIQATIRKEFSSCTVFTIAHRLNTIMDSTRVMVLDQGKIKELDEPVKLLEEKSSLFYSMAKDAGLV